LGRVEVDAGPGGLFLTGPDFADTLHIPADAIGPLQLDAFGLLADGSFAVGQPIVLNVTPAATLQGLQISPGRIGFARLGEEAAPNVLASYSDGISRDVTRLPGLAWTSSNPAIAAIGQSGRVVATGAGRAWITASYAGYVAGDSVVSAGGPRTNTPPRAVIGGPYFARPGAGVCLDGSQSTDPDLYFGDHLHFAWDLTGNGQFADGRASVACTIAGTAGNHPVALRVVDDAGDSSVTRTILTVSESVEVTAVPMPFSAVPTFAIRVLTNPAAREVMHISYSVPERASAMISVYDIAGRRVVQHQIDDVGPGVHAIDLRPRAGFTAGVYLVQLRQGASRAWARAIVVR
jgi:hypothetical protein